MGGDFRPIALSRILTAVFIIPSLLKLPKAILRLKVWLVMEGKSQFGQCRLENKYRRIIKPAKRRVGANRLAANSTTNLELFQSIFNIIRHCGHFVYATFYLFVCPRLWGQKFIRNNNLERFAFLGSLTTLTWRFLLRMNANEKLRQDSGKGKQDKTKTFLSWLVYQETLVCT